MKPTLPFVTVLAAAVLSACQSDQLLNSPDREAAASTSQREATALAVTHTFDGYAWADQPTTASYHPSSFYSFNRSGSPITITKPSGSTGRYLVKFKGLSAVLGAKSTVKVTGYYFDNNYCKPTTPRLVNDVVEVRCINGTSGGAVNAYFTVLVTRNHSKLAFAFANQPTGNNYAPPSGSSSNPSGAIRVFRASKGIYTVRFSGLGSLTTTNGGHFQVVAVGTNAVHCVIGGWGGSPDLLVSVYCFSRSGNPSDIQFNVLFLLPKNQVAYVWADQPTTTSYTPSPYYSANPGGGTVTITRSSPGQYQVHFSGLSLPDGGDVQVSAYGGTTTQCKEQGWGSQDVYVHCFAPGGAPIDSYFDLLFGS
jgi:hypothetical protein